MKKNWKYLLVLIIIITISRLAYYYWSNENIKPTYNEQIGTGIELSGNSADPDFFKREIANFFGIEY